MEHPDTNKKPFDTNENPHRRFNPLIGEWILVSPHRDKRPWQGQEEPSKDDVLPDYDAACYLCPGNVRANGKKNDAYEDVFIFENDFAALLPYHASSGDASNKLFVASPERGICKVVCFSPKHNLTLAEMPSDAIEKVIMAWKAQYIELGKIDFINHIQIFENKGSAMGCSNPHPHGQIWAQSSLPTQAAKTQMNLQQYHDENHTSLLADYLTEELKRQERIVVENENFAALVPFWATWPYETIVISKRHFGNLTDMIPEEITAFADILKRITVKYDNLFNISFPYSSGIHQTPTDGKDHPEWHFHMHFYPPLLRSATVRKFMVGYEMMGEAQRDISPEKAAKILRELPEIHYSNLLKS